MLSIQTLGFLFLRFFVIVKEPTLRRRNQCVSFALMGRWGGLGHQPGPRCMFHICHLKVTLKATPPQKKSPYHVSVIGDFLLTSKKYHPPAFCGRWVFQESLLLCFDKVSGRKKRTSCNFHMILVSLVPFCWPKFGTQK